MFTTAVSMTIATATVAIEKKISQRAFETDVREHLKFLPWAPVIFISAKTGRGLTALLKAAERVQTERVRRITTGELNRMLLRAQQAYAPKAEKGNAEVKILYGTQMGVAPPRFSISLNHPVNLHFSYKRYLENQLREAFGFEGTPLVLKVRTRKH